MYREGQDSGTTVSVYKFKFKILNQSITKQRKQYKEGISKALENRKNKSFRGYDKAKPLKVQN